MQTKRCHEGYLLIDNRFGPGVTAEFVRQSGKPAPVVTEGQIYESATITCSHCHAVVILNPARTRARNYCSKCDHYTCDGVYCVTQCKPLNRVLDIEQEKQFRLIGKG